jgi:hypothetical protein
LQIGGRVYNRQRLLEGLAFNDENLSLQITRELIATKLNLLVGSSPEVYGVVAAADAYLAGNRRDGSMSPRREQRGWELWDSLRDYNDQSCEQSYQEILAYLSRRFGNQQEGP